MQSSCTWTIHESGTECGQLIVGQYRNGRFYCEGHLAFLNGISARDRKNAIISIPVLLVLVSIVLLVILAATAGTVNIYQVWSTTPDKLGDVVVPAMLLIGFLLLLIAQQGEATYIESRSKEEKNAGWGVIGIILILIASGVIVSQN